MSSPSARSAVLDAFLAQGLRRPAYLNSGDIGGGWRELFPELARTVPAPYPIYSPDESRVLLRGYPIRLEEPLQRLFSDLRGHLEREAAYRAGVDEGSVTDKRPIVEGRRRLTGGLRSLLANAMLSDSGRGLTEVLVLTLSRELATIIGSLPVSAGRSGHSSRELRFLVAKVLADLLQRAYQEAVDQLRALAGAAAPAHRCPLLSDICLDVLPLAVHSAPLEEGTLAAYVAVHYHQDGDWLLAEGRRLLDRLAELLAHHQELAGALRAATRGRLDLLRASAVLEPRLWSVLRAMELLGRIEADEQTTELLTDVGLRLKRFELIATLRRGVVPVADQGSHQIIPSRKPAPVIAASTRPFDFTRPGVVDTTVRRFGLVYDLTRFTETLEALRKEGQRAEERALRFMYVFQHRLEEIRSRRRLMFEKYLGDGAFYSARRAMRTLAAACEIQNLYDELLADGFPFDRGIRLAINFGTYHLLPMEHRGAGNVRYEFFGHGVVELVRLTTGKSAREVEEIAEFLVHAGYSSDTVDHFLAPLLRARGGDASGGARRHAAHINAQGELINEGLVMTTPFLVELQRELGTVPNAIGPLGDLSWLVISVAQDDLPPIDLGLRRLGVARLKGLAPLELVEGTPWPGPRPAAPAGEETGDLPTLLRRLALANGSADVEDASGIPPELVVASYLDDAQHRRWAFGLYRTSDDVLLDMVEVPLEPPDLERGEPLETWVFRNRRELARLYETLRRDERGTSLPLSTLRHRDGYVGCYLAAPHRSPA